ncbi:hypothetical protein JAO73_03970 [Hymenobacter sp. BT523]|uniref:hypothetical protein n=1 Tax=Hymenobacter sp. BT523 TaxID=2795725 RepID=UPI0018EA71D6|nr:hypothetical protein [Hymenobacter sp. BT523]MBJ6108155.1 hypothetical protein [Hymenobacter sp. BT523]
MSFARWSLVVVGALLAGPVSAQAFAIPPGAYRTAAAYHRRQPAPAGVDAFYPDKHGMVVVVVPRGSRTEKLRVAPDSVWGYVSSKGRTRRLYQGGEFQLEAADTLAIYTSSVVPGGGGGSGPAVLTPGANAMGPYSAPRYFFSRGLTGLIFPLTARYLREAYGASNPIFVSSLSKIRPDQSLTDFDRKTGLFRVTRLYREAGGR